MKILDLAHEVRHRESSDSRIFRAAFTVRFGGPCGRALSPGAGRVSKPYAHSGSLSKLIGATVTSGAGFTLWTACGDADLTVHALSFFAAQTCLRMGL
jgi:hypothetical protein